MCFDYYLTLPEYARCPKLSHDTLRRGIWDKGSTDMYFTIEYPNESIILFITHPYLCVFGRFVFKKSDALIYHT